MFLLHRSDPDSRHTFDSAQHQVPPPSSLCGIVYGSRNWLTLELNPSSSLNGSPPTSSKSTNLRLRMRSNSPPTPCTQTHRAPDGLEGTATEGTLMRRENKCSDESTNGSQSLMSLHRTLLYEHHDFLIYEHHDILMVTQHDFQSYEHYDF